MEEGVRWSGEVEEGVRWSGKMVGGVLPAGGEGSLCGVLFGGVLFGGVT